MAGISLAALQARLLRIADANVIRFFETFGGRLKLRDLTTLPEAATAPISEFNIDKNGAVKIKTADKLHAIDSLIKTIGGFGPENPDGAKGTTLEDLVRASMERSDTKVAFQVETGVPRSPDGPPIESLRKQQTAQRWRRGRAFADWSSNPACLSIRP